jgi:hypothetical protein
MTMGKSPQIAAVIAPERPRSHALPCRDLPSNADSFCMLRVPVLDNTEHQPTTEGGGNLEPPVLCPGGRPQQVILSRPPWTRVPSDARSLRFAPCPADRRSHA